MLVPSIIAGVIVAVLLFRLFFKDFSDFIECLRFYFQPDLISIFRGELLDDWWGSFKLGVWFILSLAMGIGTYYKLGHWFPGPEPYKAAKAALTGKFLPSSGRSGANDSLTATQTPELPSTPDARKVKIGDTVEISALKPSIALRRATVTSVNEEAITVRAGSGDYTVKWRDLIELKASAK